MNADQTSLLIGETAGGVSFAVHVQPRASRNGVVGFRDGALRLRLTAPPVDDAANRLCIEFLARAFGIARSRVTIIAGQKSRHKTVRIDGIDHATCVAQLHRLLESNP